jgi:hypothetical protein
VPRASFSEYHVSVARRQAPQVLAAGARLGKERDRVPYLCVFEERELCDQVTRSDDSSYDE